MEGENMFDQYCIENNEFNQKQIINKRVRRGERQLEISPTNGSRVFCVFRFAPRKWFETIHHV